MSFQSGDKMAWAMGIAMIIESLNFYELHREVVILSFGSVKTFYRFVVLCDSNLKQ
jgi:hypothetical protein